MAKRVPDWVRQLVRRPLGIVGRPPRTPEEAADQELLQKALDGDMQAWEELPQATRDAVLYLLRLERVRRYLETRRPRHSGNEPLKPGELQGLERSLPDSAEVDASLSGLREGNPDALEKPPQTIAEAIAQTMIRKAIAGDVSAAKELVDRLEGPVLCPACGRVGGGRLDEYLELIRAGVRWLTSRPLGVATSAEEEDWELVRLALSEDAVKALPQESQDALAVLVRLQLWRKRSSDESPDGEEPA